jgi:hypothetical protein
MDRKGLITKWRNRNRLYQKVQIEPSMWLNTSKGMHNRVLQIYAFWEFHKESNGYWQNEILLLA